MARPRNANPRSTNDSGAKKPAAVSNRKATIVPRTTKGRGAPLVGLIMGSVSDWDTLHHAAETLEKLGVAYEAKVVSAHRTPERLFNYAKKAASRGLKVIIAGAGGAAHLPGMAASLTHLPVLGVPVEGKHLSGMDSLLSIVQMPGGVPVGTLAIGKAGAINAGLFAVSILALADGRLNARLQAFRAAQTESVPENPRSEKTTDKTAGKANA